MLILFSGVSGVGKNTVINKLLEDDRFSLMPTYTTRAMREGESEGFPYYFIDEKTFFEKVDSGELYEWVKIHNQYNGASRKILKEKLKLNKILLKDIDVIGVRNLKKVASADVDIISIFLTLDRELLKQRLIGRGEKDIDLRLSRMNFEMEYVDEYDYVIENIELNKTCEMILAMIELEKNKKELKIDCEVKLEDVDSCESKLKQGVRLPAVELQLKNGELVITKNAESYLAYKNTGIRVQFKLKY